MGALATYRETTEDRFHWLNRIRGDGPEHLLVIYSTRFNSPERVGEAQERFIRAFERAAQDFDQAVLGTLTTDPSRFDSVLSATESLMEDVNRFRAWLSTDSRLGSRPPSLVVPEFTDAGVPHAHILLFGVSWVVPRRVLSAYSSDSRDRGEVVWFDRLESRGEGGRLQWAGDGPEDAGGRSPQVYLGKILETLDGFVSASPEDVLEAARALRQADGTSASAEQPDNVSGHESGEESSGTHEPTDALARGQEWWKLALYWVTDMRLFALSPSLKSSDDTNDLPHVPCYRYVGTARLGEFPGYVRERATVLARGSPETPISMALN